MAAVIVAALEAARFRFVDEAGLQAGIAEVLAGAGLGAVSREHRLSARDRVDFVVGGVAVEVKVTGAAADVVRQLLRYAEDAAVAELVLVTTVNRHVVAMPAALRGRPLHVVHVQRPGGW